MPNDCCKYFTVSLVPVAALTLAILFFGAIIVLPVLYEELATRTRVSWNGKGGQLEVNTLIPVQMYMLLQCV